MDGGTVLHVGSVASARSVVDLVGVRVGEAVVGPGGKMAAQCRVRIVHVEGGPQIFFHRRVHDVVLVGQRVEAPIAAARPRRRFVRSVPRVDRAGLGVHGAAAVGRHDDRPPPVVDVREARRGHGGQRPRARQRALAHPDRFSPDEALLLPLPRLGAPEAADDKDQEDADESGDDGIDELQLEEVHRQGHVLVHLANGRQEEVTADPLH